MDQAAYANMAEVTDKHWWFIARRKIFSHFISKLKLPPDAEILEAGCASGGNLATFAKFGRVFAFEFDDTMRKLAEKRGIGTVAGGSLPDEIPFPGQQFDLIALPDVLEHIERDQATLKALADRLKPGGYLLITVPAFPFLWSRHDTVHHHFRRYLLPDLVHQVEATGLKIRTSNYFNFFLFSPIALVRWMERIGLLPVSLHWHTKVPHPALNRLLTEIFAAERFLIPAAKIPYGVSAFVLAQKA